MPLEKGGRADKAGNRYEIDCIIYELLNLINESNYSLVIEVLGDDEKGTDILVTRFDGTKEHQQSYFCGIIEKADYYEWSEYALNMLKDIAVNYIGEIKDKKTEETEIIDSEKLYSNALNCVRGDAARAIGHLLWENKEVFPIFKNVIDVLILDENPAIKMASFYALWPVYNIDTEWAQIRILRLYEEDVRMAAFHDSKNMFFLLYPKYKG